MIFLIKRIIRVDVESCVIIDQILAIHALKNIDETCNQHRLYATVWKKKTFKFDFSPSSTKVLFLSRNVYVDSMKNYLKISYSLFPQFWL